MVDGDVRRVMELAALLDAAARLQVAEAGDLVDAFGAFLDRLSAVSGVSRADLDDMDLGGIDALMARITYGDAYVDAVDVAGEAWGRG